MEWQDWLEKTEPTGLTPKQRKLAKEIADGDKDDHTQYYTKASWETWLEKNDPCWEGYEQYGMKDKDGKKVPNCVKKADESKPLNKPMRDDGNKKFKVFVRDPSTGNIVTVRFGDPNMEIKRDNPERRSSFRARHKCSEQKDITSAAYWSCKMWEKTSSVSDNVNKSNWEIWLEKNNAIETSHKEGEKKEEWNGKFDNSTTRDGVKDDKAQDEEEPLEELTDGKLEEVEKLKSWEVFLKGGGGTEEGLPHEEGEIAGKKNMHSLTGRYQNPTKHRKGHFANTNTGKDAVEGTPRIPTSRKGAFKDTKDTKHIGEGDVTASAVRVAQNNPDLKYLVPEAQVEQDKGLGAGTRKRELSGEEGDRKFFERVQPEPKGTKSNNRVLARRARMKSWELWLEKYDKDPNPEETDPEKIMQNAEVVGRKDNPMIKDMYKSWLEKMQGAGDARYGNQHLTGMEQHPVDDDESIDLSAESDKNNEKQEKTEKNDSKDNKPYKALS